MTNFGKQFKEFPQMQISFYTRAKGIEVCFGSVFKEEANIAASILRSLLKLNVEVRVLICQNIVLAGGSCMVPGFKLRLRQEMVHLIENKEEHEKMPVRKFFNNTFGTLLNDAIFALMKKQEKSKSNAIFTMQGSIKFVA